MKVRNRRASKKNKKVNINNKNTINSTNKKKNSKMMI